jgi:hypothetical protein
VDHETATYQPSLGRRTFEGFHQRNNSELLTTLTEESDIAAAAKAGGKSHPVQGNKRPMANGRPMRL